MKPNNSRARNLTSVGGPNNSLAELRVLRWTVRGDRGTELRRPSHQPSDANQSTGARKNMLNSPTAPGHGILVVVPDYLVERR